MIKGIDPDPDEYIWKCMSMMVAMTKINGYSNCLELHIEFSI